MTNMNNPNKNIENLNNYQSPWFLFLIASAALLLGVWLTRTYVMDDAMITLRYSYNFARFGIPIWNQADLSNPSMGYTSILWMSLNTLPALLTQNKDVLVLFTQGFALLSLLLTAWLMCKQIAALKVSTTVKIIITVLIFAQLGYGLHVNSGMETMLFTLLVLLVLLTHNNDHSSLAYLFAGLAFLCRPEGALLCVLLVLTDLVMRRFKPAILASVAYIVMLAGLYFLLMHWYGDYLPNTFYAKQELFNPTSFKRTLFFLVTLALPYLVMSIYAAFKLKHKMAIFALTIFVIYLLYYLSVDPLMNVMSRYQWPFLVLLIIGSLPAVEHLVQNAHRNKLVLVLLLITVAGLDLGNTLGAMYFANATGHAQQNIIRVGKHLAQFRQPEQWLIYHDAGAICYYSDWNTIETIGLTNGALARGQVSRAELFSTPSVVLAMQNFDLSSEASYQYQQEYSDYMSTFGFKFIENIPVLHVEGQRNFVVAVYARDEAYAHKVLEDLVIDRSFKPDLTYKLYRFAKEMVGN